MTARGVEHETFAVFRDARGVARGTRRFGERMVARHGVVLATSRAGAMRFSRLPLEPPNSKVSWNAMLRIGVGPVRAIEEALTRLSSSMLTNLTTGLQSRQ
jgi:hypothetical protein